VPTVLRIIVGASGSPCSLRALRYAQHLARDYNATLVPVLAWLPPCGDLADRRTPNEELRQILAQDARQQLQDALNLAWEHCSPTSLPIRLLVPRPVTFALLKLQSSWLSACPTPSIRGSRVDLVDG
jgi:nucleotide-binding universal stress UspA family protein